MSIDWNKAESSPSFKQKIEGKDLLNLRNKINQLESRLQEANTELKQAKSELEENKNKIKTLEKGFNDDLVATKEKLFGLENEKQNLTVDLAKVKEQLKDSENELELAKYNQEKEIETLTEEWEQKLIQAQSALEKKLEEKDTEINEGIH